MPRALAALAGLALVLTGSLASAQQPARPDSAALAAQAALIAQAQAEGQIAAANVGTGGWFGGGFVSGLLAGVIGTGITYAFAANSNVDMPPERRLLIMNHPLPYQQVYESAFARKVRSKRRASALTGGLLGTATLVLIVISAQSGE